MFGSDRGDSYTDSSCRERSPGRSNRCSTIAADAAPNSSTFGPGLCSGRNRPHTRCQGTDHSSPRPEHQTPCQKVRARGAGRAEEEKVSSRKPPYARKRTAETDARI